MSQEELDNREHLPEEGPLQQQAPEPAEHHRSTHVTKLSGLYQDWFLDYASYVILERAVPLLGRARAPSGRMLPG